MIDLSASADPEILLAARALKPLDVTARAAGGDYLVVGATARTILSLGLIGRSLERATRDVDIAVEVCTWGDFERLVGSLERRGRSAHSFLVEAVESKSTCCPTAASRGKTAPSSGPTTIG
jgi:predicted nucleotidyltransferase